MYVDQMIGTDFLEFSPREPVFISTPTGSGKTTFILKTLLPYGIEHRKRILFISNRCSVSGQIRYKLLKMHGIPEENFQDFSDIYEFDGITVITYQKMESIILERQKLSVGSCVFSEFSYLVMDELHYILEDSAFNARTNVIASLPNYFPKAIKIFMSATLNKVKEFMFGDAMNLGPDALSWCREYSVEPDYSWVQPFFIRDYDDIIKRINLQEEERNGEKWLIWTNSKEEGRQLMRRLKCSCAFIQSEWSGGMSQDDKRVFEDILVKEQFATKVLISTKVLDNGVNLCDRRLKNMVISATDEIEFKQMLGRKRLQGDDDDCRVYLFCRNRRFFEGCLHFTFYPKKNLIKAVERGGEAGLLQWMLQNECDSAKKGTVYLHRGTIRINAAAKYMVETRIQEICGLLEQFTNEGGNAFLNWQLGWIGKKYAEHMWLDFYEKEQAWKALEGWAKTMEKRQMTKEEWTCFRKEIRDRYYCCVGERLDTEHPSRVPSIGKVNEILMKMNLIVRNKSRGVWEICRLN